MKRKPNGNRILIVDDDSSVAGSLEELLTDEGYEVQSAGNGTDALEILMTQDIQVLLTDIRMKNMDGLELIREARHKRPDTEIVIMTAFATIETAIEALRFGAYDFLVKPFEDLTKIPDVIKRALHKRRIGHENRRIMDELQRKNGELLKSNLEIREQAVRDGLTGLYNFRFFQEALKNEVIRSKRHGRRLCLLMIDVDYFKGYNDRHGHPMGDQVLKDLGRIFIDRMRQSDFVARYGGEEFAVILPETDRTQGLNVAEDIRNRVERHRFSQKESKWMEKITVSIGVAEYPRDGLEVERIIEQADSALYEAKASGRNRVQPAATQIST
ncbi:MAG TPA: diguanylate cyclase [Nitrospiria bacterium]